MPPRGYLRRVSEICRKYGVLLIADETITAFWRTGSPFYSAAEEVDMVVGGKCLAAGLAPICAVLLSGSLAYELRELAAPLPLRLTFAGNPLACLAAVEVQRYAEEHGLGSRVRANDNRLRQIIYERMRGCPSRTVIDGVGHLWSIAVECRTSDEASGMFDRARQKAEAAGLELMGGVRTSSDTNWFHLMLAPAFDCSDEDLHACVDGARL